MTKKTREILSVQKELIRTENTKNANTADRVGNMFGDILDSYVSFLDDLVNNLTTDVPGKALDAQQGFILLSALQAIEKTSSLEFTIGYGATGDKSLHFGTGGTSLRYNSVSEALEFSNNGTTWIPLGQSGSAFDKGYFPDQATLEANYPTATNGSWAYVGTSTVTRWIWQTGTGWVNTGDEVSFLAETVAMMGSTKLITSGGVYTALQGKAASVHSHAISEITGLQAILDAKLNSDDLDSRIFTYLVNHLKFGDNIGIITNSETGDITFNVTTTSGGSITLGSTPEIGGTKAFSTGGAYIEFAKYVGRAGWTSVVFDPSIATNVGSAFISKFKIPSTANFAISSITSTSSDAALIYYKVKLVGVSSVEMTLPSSVLEDGLPITGNKILIEGTVGSEHIVCLEKDGSNWDLYRQKPGAVGVSAFADLEGNARDNADLAAELDGLQGQIDVLVLEGNEYEEYADLASFPATGASDRIYAALDTGFTYRWSGSAYVQIGGSTVTPSSLGTLINSTTAKSTPVDADIFSIFDSAASWIAKKITWANIKTALASIFVGKSGFVSAPPSGGVITIALNDENLKYKSTLTGNFTYEVGTVADGANVVHKVNTGAVSTAITITFDSSYTHKSLNNTVTSYTLPAGAGKEYFITFIVEGTTIEVSVVDGTGSTVLSYSSSTEINTATESAKVIAPDQLEASKYLSQYLNKIFAVATGPSNTYAVTLSPAVTAYPRLIVAQINVTNTGASTINPNGLGAKAITKNGTTAVASGDLPANQIFILAYDGTQYQIIGNLGTGGGSGTVTSFSAGDFSPLFTTTEATPTSTPALSFSAINQAANLFFAGPSSGSSAAPTFRALVLNDLANNLITYAKLQQINAGPKVLGLVGPGPGNIGEINVVDYRDTLFGRTEVTGSSYTILPSDKLIAVKSVPCTITFPALSTLKNGQPFRIIDETGSAGTSNITIAVTGSDVNNGATVINSNYAKAVLYVDKTSTPNPKLFNY
jgi:hypothetical protein